MTKPGTLRGTLIVIAMLAAGCSSQPGPAGEAAAEGSSAPAAAEVPPPSPPPDSVAAGVPVSDSPTTAPARTPPVVDVGGTVEVAATKPDLTRVGSDACKMCHKVQFASWAESAHAVRTPPLDCESCHGPGSAYKSLAVMKDPEKARAAGLVIPDRAFCSTCHKTGWTDDLLQQAHAHKDKPA